ncbi:MAG TPA: GSCFA domain-containing protein [Rhizomicrobium sp.]|nr:GSCFA domain-containing protein [Rhizomicrobium sp.]
MTSVLGKKRRRDNQVAFTQPGAGLEKKIGSSFYRGDAINFNPQAADFDKDEFLSEYVLKGWTPPQPVLTKGTKITAFGSCFAMHITKHLSERGFDLSRDREPDIYISAIGEGLVNTQALLGQLEWALLGKKPPENLWHGFKAEGFGYDEDIRRRTEKVFRETEFFIITLGLSEVWYDEVSGGVLWRAVPLESFDASRHKFRVNTIAETKADLARIYALVREHIPGAKVLFTLSPIPLAATFRPVSCMTANAVSKAILRAALDEVIRDNGADLNARLFYFPSYEIAQELFPRRFQLDGRHLANNIVPTIMAIFESVYCESTVLPEDATRLFRETRESNMASLHPEKMEKRKARKAGRMKQFSGDVDDGDTPRKGTRRSKRLARKAEQLRGKA